MPSSRFKSRCPLPWEFRCSCCGRGCYRRIAMTSRPRIIAFALFVAACLAGTAWYVWHRIQMNAPAPVEESAATAIDELRVAPHVAFLSAKEEAFGRIGLAR